MKLTVFLALILYLLVIPAYAACGWYIMGPSSDAKGNIIGAPLAQWRNLDSADSARDCTWKRKALLAQIQADMKKNLDLSRIGEEKIKRDKTKSQKDDDNIFVEMYNKIGIIDIEEAMSIVCISVSDPRLKP